VSEVGGGETEWGRPCQPRDRCHRRSRGCCHLEQKWCGPMCGRHELGYQDGPKRCRNEGTCACEGGHCGSKGEGEEEAGGEGGGRRSPCFSFSRIPYSLVRRSFASTFVAIAVWKKRNRRGVGNKGTGQTADKSASSALAIGGFGHLLLGFSQTLAAPNVHNSMAFVADIVSSRRSFCFDWRERREKRRGVRRHRGRIMAGREEQRG